MRIDCNNDDNNKKGVHSTAGLQNCSNACFNLPFMLSARVINHIFVLYYLGKDFESTSEAVHDWCKKRDYVHTSNKIAWDYSKCCYGKVMTLHLGISGVHMWVEDKGCSPCVYPWGWKLLVATVCY